jgi:hypothetical protein
MRADGGCKISEPYQNPRILRYSKDLARGRIQIAGMSPYSYALITPSFRLDFDRCKLLVESAERWVAPHVHHYLVIDRRDVPMFSSLRSSRTSILIVEDIIPPWLFRLPVTRRFWFSFRTLPVRNWILQQIVKLSIPSVVEKDVLLCTDSDTFFVAPYDPREFERDGKVPLFVETGQRGLIKSNDEWHRVAAGLLGLAPEASYDTNYIGNVIPWRRDTGLALQRRISEVTGKPWQLALSYQPVFAEYILYGMFTHGVLGQSSGQWDDGELRTLTYWKTIPLGITELQELKAQRLPQHYSVMISAKSKTPVADIRKVFFDPA